MSQDQIQTFQYFIAEKKPVLVVTFVGNVDDAAVDSFRRCKDDIAKSKTTRFLIFYFRDVESISGEGVRFLTHLQMEARAQSQINICSLKPEIKEKLIAMGVVRKYELSNNMRDAMAWLTQVSAGSSKLKVAK